MPREIYLMHMINLISELLESQPWSASEDKAFTDKLSNYRKELAVLLQSSNAVQHHKTIRRCESKSH